MIVLRLEVGDDYFIDWGKSDRLCCYRLILSQKLEVQTSGEKLIVIGSDGGLLAAPVEGLQIGIAERYDIVIDFSKHLVGSSGTIDSVEG